MLQTDWAALAKLEASTGEAARDLASDARDNVSKPLRLIFQLIHANQLPEALAKLRSILVRLPDSKIVEDIHQKLRNEANANTNRRLLPRELQGLVQTSGVLESRKIPHAARLDKPAFLRSWKTTPSKFSFQKSLDSGLVKLPPFFAGLMSDKNWRSLSEEAISCSSAAWAWLRAYLDQGLKASNCKLQVPWSSSLNTFSFLHFTHGICESISY